MKKRVGRWFAGSCLVIALSVSVLARALDAGLATANAGGVPDATQIQQRVAGLAVPFEANTGQADKHVAFTARTFAGTLFVTRTGQLVHSFPGLPLAAPEAPTARNAVQKRGPGWVLTESLVNAHPVLRGGAESATRVSRFIGNDPAQWQRDIATFQTVSLGTAWPGIDVELAARGNNVEKLFTVAPGADARRIAIRLHGAKRLELAADGALVAHTGNGPVSFTAPVAWQDIDGARQVVTVAYTLVGNRYGLLLGDYNHSYAVVIDPLLRATYLGGSGNDSANAIAFDTSRNVFVTGSTDSTNFPGTIGGAQSANSGGSDVFVAKLNNGLTALIQATYLGGSGTDVANAVAVDTSGNVFVAGATASTNFPGTTGGPQPGNGGGQDAFVAKLNNGLTSLTQATYLGGSGTDEALAIALDSNNNVFVTGDTTSTNLPGTAGGAQAAKAGSQDAFVAKLNNGLTTLTQATYLGGSGVVFQRADAIALDTNNNVFVTGGTNSITFPGTAGGAQSANGGGNLDAFVAKLNNALTTLTQASYLGGGGHDEALAIMLDGNNNVFVAGYTDSINLPNTAGGAQAANGGGQDTFVAKLNNGLTTLNQATYLGGSGTDTGYAIARDASNNVFVAASTDSTNLPGTAGGAQPAYGGGVLDAFIAKLNNSLTMLIQTTYLGGSADEETYAIALDTSGNVFVAGYTASTNFPGTVGGAQSTNGGGCCDAVVAKLTPNLTAAGGVPPVFQSAVSRKVHGGAGTFDLPLSAVATNPTTEPRQGPAQTIVFTFDKPISAATVTITEGTATAGVPTFGGNDVVVGLTGVNNQQYVTISLANVASADGGTGGSGSVRVGFLLGDVNQNRVVTVADLGLVNQQLAQVVTAANYLKDVNASGTLTVADKGITNANLTRSLPAP